MKATFKGLDGKWYRWGSNDDPRVLEKGKTYDVERVDTHSSYTNLIINGRPYNCVDFVCPVHGDHNTENDAIENVAVERRAAVYLTDHELSVMQSMLKKKIRQEERDRERPRAKDIRTRHLAVGHRDRSQEKMERWARLLERVDAARQALAAS